MKSLLRNTAFYSFALFLLSVIFPGFTIQGGLKTYLIAGFTLTFIVLIIKPILKVVTFPLSIVTLGLFSAVINVIVLYLLTILIPSITIHSFTFQGLSLAGFIIPKITFGIFSAYFVIAVALSGIIAALSWLTK
ncbi:MAG: phage holin family protein [Candidatus Levybacteria bacterium]|nr:phage holin family protein [Candidatus Levybacteria bacterium]